MLGKALLSASVSAPPAVYVEDVFSTYLYTGNSSTQTITNGIDLAGEGGLVWIKSRSIGTSHVLTDTARGSSSQLYSDRTNAQGTVSDQVTAFTGSGFSLGTDSLGTGTVNTNPVTYASWTFRKAPKFFDVVTFSANNSTATTVTHALESTPGCIIVKKTDGLDAWWVYHRSIGTAGYVVLSSTTAQYIDPNFFTSVTSTTFTTGAGYLSTGTYVAYLFAHDAGGFGDSGDQSVVKCGSYTADGLGNPVTIDLGWEPQWILAKRSNGISSWFLIDSMRGIATGGNDAELYPDSSNAESLNDRFELTATGFKHIVIGASQAWVYIAIRRGPMRVPTLGTSVYNAIVRNGTGAVANITGVGFPPDLITVKNRTAGYDNNWVDKLRGALPILASSKTAAEVTNTTTAVTAFDQDGVTLGDNNIGTYGGAVNASTVHSYVNWFFRRAPGFFDVVAYAGNYVDGRTLNHNLSAVPELMIVKGRGANTNPGWYIYHKDVFIPGSPYDQYLTFTSDAAETTSTTLYWDQTRPTASVFTLGGGNGVNQTGYNYIAYLFATCPGVSKVGSYTGTGTTLNIDCGFAAGARFVLIKRTDSTGDWYVWDTARGIVSGDDPYLLLNSAATEVTNTDYIDPLSSGFQISSTAPAEINASGGSFIFLAIA